MQNVQARFPDEMIKKIDELVKSGTYTSRSEAIRDAVRIMVLERWKIAVA